MTEDPRNYIDVGARRLALKRSENGWLHDWWIGTSPRNGDHAQVEGSWNEWVKLAQAILAADRARRGVDRTDVEQFADYMADQFNADLEYVGADIKHRIEIMAHIMAPDHPADGEPCAVCRDDDEVDA